MPRRISAEARQSIETLYARGVPIAEIARRGGVSYFTAYVYTRAKERGLASSSEYREHLARQQGFASLGEYNEHLAKGKNFLSMREYEKHLLEQRGFASKGRYEENLAEQLGLASGSEYQQHLAMKRQQQPANQTLRALIKRRLTKLRRSQRWLAEQLNITESTVSRYAQGSTMPRKGRQQRLFQVLGVSYKTLDELLK